MTGALVQSLGRQRIVMLRDLTRLSSGQLERILSGAGGRELNRAVSAIPVLEIQLRVRGEHGVGAWVEVSHSGAILPREGELQVSLKKMKGDPKNRVFAPRYYKPKVATYWLVISTGSVLLACRRVDISRIILTTTTTFKLAQGVNDADSSSRSLKIQIFSDSMMGSFLGLLNIPFSLQL
jgi:hypothetical protein